MTTNSVGLAEISFQKVHPNESYSQKHKNMAQPTPGMGRVKVKERARNFSKKFCLASWERSVFFCQSEESELRSF